MGYFTLEIMGLLKARGARFGPVPKPSISLKFPAIIHQATLCSLRYSQGAGRGGRSFLPHVGLARSNQDPVNRGHGAQYLYHPPPAGAVPDMHTIIGRLSYLSSGY